MLLQDKTVLITGGRRIGAAVGAELARRGMDVTFSYNRSRADAETAAAAVRGHGRRVFLIQADLGTPSACIELVEEAALSMGRLDVLINMASVYTNVPFDSLDADAWDAVLNVDLRAAFLCARAAVPHMRKAGGGRIVNFSDWIAASGRPRYAGFLPYYVAKRGIIGLTEALALELAGDQILVNAIAPGPILPPPGTTDDELRQVEAATPLGRWGGEAEIAAAVLYLLDTGFTTGETVRVDGGRHVR